MKSFHAISRRLERTLLAAIVALFVAVSIVGITWGLPSRKIDRFLFGDAEPWSGEKIYRLAGAGSKFSPDRGADVDVDPLTSTGDEPVLLTGTDEDVAKIYLRYRLYTYQPDEMITMMALAGMRPRELKFDPRLYQYGGAFIYPVGTLIGACGWLGLIDVRSDVVYYLDNPDEFGKFYVVARAYSAAWGVLGVFIVFAIARRIGGVGRGSRAGPAPTGGMGKRSLPVDESEPRAQATGQAPTPDNVQIFGFPTAEAMGQPRGGSRAGLLAALLFALMPVVVCMSHEGKPHLPGAVLMLAAVLFAMRYLSALAASGDRSARCRDRSARRRRRDWWLMCICCGAAFGMVLSSLPIFVLIPLVAWLGATADAPAFKARLGETCKRSVAGVGIAVAVYLVTNPYIVINAIGNRDVLRSNFGNSLAMYDIARIGEGLIRVLELTVEGATLPVLVVGAIALLIALWRMLRRHSSEPGGQATGQAGASAHSDDIFGSPTAEAMGHPDGLGDAWRHPAIVYLPVIVPAVVFFVQFVLIGAGKPAEYGRFGIFPNTALAVGAACLLTRRWTKLREIVNWIPAVFVVLWVGFFGESYLRNFRADCQDEGTRYRVALAYSHWIEEFSGSSTPGIVYPRNGGLATLVEPAPYCFPPVNFVKRAIWLYPPMWVHNARAQNMPIIQFVDRATESLYDPPPFAVGWNRPGNADLLPTMRSVAGWRWRVETPISWANKPILVLATDGKPYPIWSWTGRRSSGPPP